MYYNYYTYPSDPSQIMPDEYSMGITEDEIMSLYPETYQRLSPVISQYVQSAHNNIAMGILPTDKEIDDIVETMYAAVSDEDDFDYEDITTSEADSDGAVETTAKQPPFGMRRGRGRMFPRNLLRALLLAELLRGLGRPRRHYPPYPSPYPRYGREMYY